MEADLVLYNGVVYDMVSPSPGKAIAIRAGKVLRIGSNQEILSLLGPEGLAIDLKGATAIPGLVDGHFHLLGYAMRLISLDLSGLDSKEKVLEKVAAKAFSTPPGQWITGGGWDRNLWPDPSFPTCKDLDRVSPHNPVALYSKDGHTIWLNSLALRELGITPSTPDPPGGVIERDPHGQPTGILKEKAVKMVRQAMEAPSSPLLQQAVEEALESLIRKGLVGLHNCEDERALALLQEMKNQGKLKMRILHHIPAENLEAAVKLGIKSGFGDDYLRIGGVKIFADGSLGSRTAAMLEPYLEEPENLGILILTREELEALVLKAGEAGLSVAIHAIGDRANRVVLDVLEKAPRLRHRIEHVQLLAPEDMPRLAKLGIVASMQPIHATSDMEMAERYWGKERCRWAYAWRSLLEEGTILAFGSDCPVEPPDPLLGIHAAVTRRRLDGSPGPEGWFPEQRLKVEEAVRAYTWGNAFAAGEEKKRGTLAPNMLADISILSEDIFRIPPEKIPATEVLGTVIGGEIAFIHASISP
ncbi:MAG: amidohydrolase [Anaerolineae bacterium]|nr:amidohydrolase [Anaerolineae bacterium]MDW8101886.1 amidohydrolase [Anaerolineae bacterium]